MKRWTWVLVTWSGLAWSACDGAPVVEWASRVDSAGLEVVENGARDQPLEVTWTRAFALGGEPSGPESFYQLTANDFSVGDDGTVAVLNRPAYMVSVFTGAGDVVSSFGREGDGPGELSYPSGIAVASSGDVVVYDYRKRALTRFDRNGTFLEQEAVAVPFNGFGMQATPAGLLLLSRTTVRGAGESEVRLLHVTAADTVQLGPAVTGASKSIFYESCQVSMSLPPLFASDFVWASNGERTAIAPGADYSITVFDGSTPVSVVRREIEPETVTPGVVARVLGEGERWGIAGQECVVPVDEVVDQRGYADALPVIEALAVDPEGGLWVKRRVTGSEERAIDVFDSTGEYIGSASGEEPFPVRFLPDGRVATIERDELDVDRLVVYSVALGG